MTTNFSAIVVNFPIDKMEKFTIESKFGTLVIREPLAIDYAIVESLGKNPTMHERCFALAQRLAVSFNGEAGVTEGDIALLDRKGYKELMSLTLKFFMEIAPDTAMTDDFINKFLPESGTDNGTAIASTVSLTGKQK